MITNLDKEFPEDDYFEFNDREGNLYKVKMSIPVDAGFTIIDNFETILKIFPSDGGRPKPTKEAYEIIIKIIADICHAEYDMIDRDWIRKNVSLPRLVYIVFKMAKPIYQFLTTSGFVETLKEN